MSTLEDFGRILNRVCKHTGTTLAREDELARLMRHLNHAQHNSILLLGPSGCGKTALISELVARQQQEDRPWLVVETSTSIVMKGTQYIGEWETRLMELLENAERDERIAIYWTDIANIMGAGTTSRSRNSMAHAILPRLESGSLTIIAECDDEQYRRNIAPHPVLRNAFTVFPVSELSDDDVRQVIQGVAGAKSSVLQADRHVDLQWTPAALERVQEFGSVYFPGAARPAGAVRLIDQVIVQLHELVKGDTEGDWEGPPSPLQIHGQHIVHALESFSGIPRRLLDDSQALPLGDVKRFFETRVVGQDTALNAMVDLITLIKAGLTDPKKPLGVMLFAGPTGVGKTEMARTLAEFIFGSPERMLRYDMSEFKDYNSFEKLIGNPQASEQSLMHSGSLLSKVRQQPFQVLLLDEIEKAHRNIFDLLLQLFDAGRLTDVNGKTTDFSQTIIIMTSNLGSDLSETSFGFGGTPGGSDCNIEKAIKDKFRPEFVNRLSRIVKFKPLEQEHILKLAQRELGQVLLRSGIRRRQLRVDVDPGVVEILAKAGFDRQYGARPLKRAVEDLALLPIARQLVKATGNAQPALLRLRPAGQQIKLEIIHDRQARKSAELAGRTDSVPVRRRTNGNRAITPRLEDMNEQLAHVEQRSNELDLAGQKDKLITATNAVDFWDNSKRARNTLSDLYRVERLLEAQQRLRKRSEDLTRLLTDNPPPQRDDEVGRLLDGVDEVQRHAKLLRYSLNCKERIDRCDAFVALSAVSEGPADNVGRLADMYTNWACNKGFKVTVLHESLYGPRNTRELTLLIEGVAIYGILKGEEGIHAFDYGKDPSGGKDAARKGFGSHFVKVRVLPLVEAEAGALADLYIKRQPSKGKGERCPNYRSEVTVAERSGNTSITARSDQSPNDAARTATLWLWAERSRMRRSGGPEPSPAEQFTHPVRRYTMQPRQVIKDYRSGVSSSRMKDVWRGEIDQFLLGRIQAP